MPTQLKLAHLIVLATAGGTAFYGSSRLATSDAADVVAEPVVRSRPAPADTAQAEPAPQSVAPGESVKTESAQGDWAPGESAQATSAAAEPLRVASVDPAAPDAAAAPDDGRTRRGLALK